MNCRHKLLRHAIEPVNHMHRCETARGAAARSVLSSSSISSDPNLKLDGRACARGPLCLRVATVATSKASSGSSSIAVGRRRQHAAAPALARLHATPKHAHERERPARATLFFLAKGLARPGGRDSTCCHHSPSREEARPTQSKARVGSRRDRPRRPTPRRQVAAPPRKGAASVNGVCCQYSLRKDHGGGGGGASACRCRCPLARDIGMGLWRADPMAETGRSGRGP